MSFFGGLEVGLACKEKELEESLAYTDQPLKEGHGAVWQPA